MERQIEFDVEVPGRNDLKPGEIHIWRCPLDVADWRWRELESVLSEAERDRARRFHFERDRRRFAVRRAFQRHVLAGYLGVTAEAVPLDVGERGKPQLAAASPKDPGSEDPDSQDPGSGDTAPASAHEPRELHFNLSKSEELAALAVTLEGPLGIDIEAQHDLPDLSDLIETVFSPAERAEIEPTRGSRRLVTFFNGWTRKEAFVKAVGQGLYFPLAAFDVSLLPEAPAELRAVREGGIEASSWRILTFDPGAGFAGALVVPDGTYGLRFFDWQPAA